MAIAGVYKRILPCPPAIEFASEEGKVLFAEAFADGTMNGFFKLIGTFQTQQEPAYCGLTSLSVVLNALSIDPGRKWKGPWRWFDESMLDCCEPLEKVKQDGITFAKVACLGKCAGASVLAFRASQSSPDAFRAYVEECVSSEDRHLIVSYDRRLLRQTGTGHFSPLGGYHRQRDMALILDVARFKYPPHWVPVSLLWEGLNTIDESTGKSRGFMAISKFESTPSVLFTLSCKDESWRAMSKYLTEDVPQLLGTKVVTDAQEVVDTILTYLPAEVASFVNWIVEIKLVEAVDTTFDKEETDRLQGKRRLLQQLRETEIHYLVAQWMSNVSECCLPTTEESLQQLVAQACCQGAATLFGVTHPSNITCTGRSYTTKQGSGADEPAAVVSSNISINGCEHIVDALVPTVSNILDSKNPITANNLHPVSTDALSILILALPDTTWREIPNPDVQKEMHRIVSRARLPTDLQREVVQLSEQAILVNRLCKDDLD